MRYIPPTATSHAPAGAAGPKRSSILSGPSAASTELRHKANLMKRMASLTAAAIASQEEPEAVVRAAEEITAGVLKQIGYDIDDANRMRAVVPMLMESASLVVADALRNSKPGSLGQDNFRTMVKQSIVTLSAIARSRFVEHAAEAAWPADIDAVTAIRMTTTAAMSLVAVEVAEFDYFQGEVNCLKEASKVVTAAALRAVTETVPDQAPDAARLMITQSLIQSAARLYAATYRRTAYEDTERINALPDGTREEQIALLEKLPPHQALAEIKARFEVLFQELNAASELLLDAKPIPEQQAAAPTGAQARPLRRPGSV